MSSPLKVVRLSGGGVCLDGLPVMILTGGEPVRNASGNSLYETFKPETLHHHVTGRSSVT